MKKNIFVKLLNTKLISAVALIILASILFVSIQAFGYTGDYRGIGWSEYGMVKPTAGFLITNNTTGDTFYSDKSANTIGVGIPVMKIKKGDTLSFSDRSSAVNPGESIIAWDFQLDKANGESNIKSLRGSPKIVSHTFTSTGTYYAYLCVKADLTGTAWNYTSSKYWTVFNQWGWSEGLWSQNGQHSVYSSKTGGNWYFTKVQIDCTEQPAKTLDRIAVTPKYASFKTNSIYTNEKVKVIAYYTDGTNLDVTSSSTLASPATNIVYYSPNDGYLHSGANTGNIGMSASYPENGITKTDSISVNVTEQPVKTITRINIEKPSYSMNTNSSDTITVYGYYSDGTSAGDITNSVTYLTTNSSIAKAIGRYLYSYSAGNNVTITAKYNGYTDTCTVNVSAPVKTITRIDIEKPSYSMNTNSSDTITVYGYYSDGTSAGDITNSVTYLTTNSSIAKAIGRYLYSYSAGNNVTITAKYNGYTDTCTVNVSAPVKTITRIDIEKPSYSMNTNSSDTITVYGYYSDGTSAGDITNSIDYTTTDSSVAKAIGRYLYSYSAGNNVTITAKYNGYTDTCTVNVSAPGNNTGILKGIEVTPTQKTINGLNTTSLPVSVTAIYDNGSKKDVTNTSKYNSLNPSIATVNEINYKLKSGVKEGNTYIEITYTEGGITRYESIYVKVIDDLDDIDEEETPEGIVELEKIEIIPGEKQTIEGFEEYGDTLKVRATYSDDTTEYVTEDVEFESEDEDVAYVTTSYKVKSGEDEGTVEITATYEEDGITKKDTIDVKVVEDDEDDDDDIDDDMNSNVSGLRVELKNKQNRIKYLEGTKVTYYVDYYNGTDEDIEDVKITLTFPKKMTVIDADGGTKSTTKITWDVGTVDSDDTGRYEVELEYKDVSGTDEIELIAKIYEDDDEEDDSEVKNLIYEKNASGQHSLYMLGYPDGTFRPENKITRQELAAAIVRLFNLSSVGSNNYSFGNNNSYNANYNTAQSRYKDVTPQTCWGYNEIMTATNLGLLSGYSDGTFRPEAPITKAEFLAIIARRMEVANKETLTIHFPEIRTYWAANEIEQLYRLKLVLDSDLVTKNITQAITRAEVVTILNRVNYRGPLRTGTTYFGDVSSYYWASGDIQEAAINHGYNIDVNGEEKER
ncbi:MAG: hypothetical protein A2Y22_06465 [Clostridiales bacterium GWD2_32_59]|nr:MAG: hypothetical protein A2Y22_06465 [Clostridiales bacterium GWD2_32_59]